MTTDFLPKIQALLTKAERTEFPAEAEAFMAKAQELMTVHAIDEAMLASKGKSNDEIITKSIAVENPYAGAKMNLLAHICRTNGTQVITSKTHGYDGKKKSIVLIGWKSEVENTEVLFTALLLHATRAMLAAKPAPGENTKSFRQSFLIGYGSRIGSRLEEARKAAVNTATNAHGGEGASMALVLVDRAEHVDAFVADAFPRLRKGGSASYRNTSGVGHGARAANGANLGQPGVGGSRLALNA